MVTGTKRRRSTKRRRKTKTFRSKVKRFIFRRSRTLRKARAFRNRMRRRVKVLRTLSQGRRPTKVRMFGDRIRERVLVEWPDGAVTLHTFYSAMKLQSFARTVHNQGGRILSQTPF